MNFGLRNEIMQPTLSVYGTADPRHANTACVFQPETSLPLSASTSTSKAQSSKTSLFVLTPPPYTSLDDSQSLGHSSYNSVGEAGISITTTGTPGNTNRSCENKRDEEEDEENDVAELPRMISMRPNHLCLDNDWLMHFIVELT